MKPVPRPGCRACLQLDQAPAHRVANQPGRFVDVELLHQARAMRFGRLVADVQNPGDLFGRFALGDQLQDLALPRRQLLRARFVLVQNRIDQ